MLSLKLKYSSAYLAVTNSITDCRPPAHTSILNSAIERGSVVNKFFAAVSEVRADNLPMQSGRVASSFSLTASFSRLLRVSRLFGRLVMQLRFALSFFNPARKPYPKFEKVSMNGYDDANTRFIANGPRRLTIMHGAV